ncbi:hypothetical protein H6G54_02545 [Anabaena cylindrica FACHB-243]|uniref:Uncharacterized protein n=1 Tax=Anabaena cylindrica (strain ATCC 27899 / PCC 7122) TaxID=272123 RepID=K9ZL46_ANACC|nr:MULTISPECIES: hypothetical protein [Anabaena]AFZ59252.1 hypothetical protein Anacy_3877 [Anabaena cylindrica PCC 7122]MBD2416607.1 hypothetical protein [Anabaena cylindrica FACHB-243]MBY5285428.1 hypothetical protein [Anabaena sp. CCAP 1446/1C]MBY5310736.1 hypothetical protein [Anabaena sp. CCAP 1446/1C]MCM2407545.1 hypothetical protein [Anabaena sp. CCAP 1446/1C]
MLYSQKIENQELLTDLSAEASANIKGGQSTQEQGDQGGNGESQGEKSKSNQSKYLQALGFSYLAPPGTNEITEKEALLAQYLAWKD